MGDNKPLPSNGRIELSFDRLLLPASVTRQAFVLENAGGTIGFTPEIAYDPVARVVTITPLSDSSQALQRNDSYRLMIVSPMGPTDPNGLRAIDGATMNPASPTIFLFTVTDPLATPPTAPSIDYCRDIDVIFGNNCEQGICHGENPAAAGLILSPPSSVTRTAIGRVAQGANTGPRSIAEPPSHLFGEDMPIIDPQSNPSDSWMMYKVLLAMPSPAPIVEAGADAEALDATTEDVAATEAGAEDGASSGTGSGDAGGDAGGVGEAGGTDAGGGDGGASAEAGPTTVAMAPPVDVSHAHQLGWQGMSNLERTILSNYILGREMPFPSTPPVSPALTLDQMERLSLWMAQGATVPANCP